MIIIWFKWSWSWSKWWIQDDDSWQIDRWMHGLMDGCANEWIGVIDGSTDSWTDRKIKSSEEHWRVGLPNSSRSCESGFELVYWIIDHLELRQDTMIYWLHLTTVYKRRGLCTSSLQPHHGSYTRSQTHSAYSMQFLLHSMYLAAFFSKG